MLYQMWNQVKLGSLAWAPFRGPEPSILALTLHAKYQIDVRGVGVKKTRLDNSRYLNI